MEGRVKLERRQVEKPWGRDVLPPPFEHAGGGEGAGARIGEIWFEAPDGRDLPLLIKYIFTSEKLSVQVHPDDAQARSRGLPRGKSECWFIIDAEPGATLGLGFGREVDAGALRAAALDGSIEEMMTWKPVKAGDFFFVPAGTVHAIGGGVSLIEVQQNSDVTYRLYDYGRPRELHLEDGVAVAKAAPYADGLGTHLDEGEDRLLVEGPHFTLWHVASGRDPLAGRERWVVPVSGRASAGGEDAAAGECLYVGANDALEIAPGTRMLVAAAV